MIRAILDTNVLVQAAFNSPRSASCRVLRAYDAGKFLLVFSPATLNELLEVLLVPHIRAAHGWSDRRGPGWNGREVVDKITTFLRGDATWPERKPREMADWKRP